MSMCHNASPVSTRAATVDQSGSLNQLCSSIKQLLHQDLRGGECMCVAGRDEAHGSLAVDPRRSLWKHRNHATWVHDVLLLSPVHGSLSVSCYMAQPLAVRA